MTPARRSFALLVALVLVAAHAVAQGAARDPASLVAAIGSAKGERRATFIEIKTSSLLYAPLESRGTLLFRAPDLLEKITTSPQRERIRIEGDTLTVEGAPIRGQAQRRVIALSDVPLLAPLVESLRATLAGDLPALQRHYEVSLVRERWPIADENTRRDPRNDAAKKLAGALAGAAAWTLMMVPRDPALRGAIERVLMHGVGAEIVLVEFAEVSGDRTQLWITPVR